MSAPELLSRDYFESLQKKLFPLLRPKEHLILTLAGESSQFIRLNGADSAPVGSRDPARSVSRDPARSVSRDPARSVSRDPARSVSRDAARSVKIRQIGTVNDATIGLTLIFEESETLHRAAREVTLSGIGYLDQAELVQSLEALQREAREIPPDPYAELPSDRGRSSTESKGRLLAIEDAPGELAGPARGLDLAGIYASGPSVRAMADSAGTSHWFSTETFSFDYSLYTPEQRALKGMIAGKSWDSEKFAAELAGSSKKLALLEKPARRVERGTYRAYLEPAAFGDLVAMLSWGTIGEAAIRQGDSPLRKIRSGNARFSPLFTLSEDFRGGETPRFNDEGELAAEQLALFDRGELRNTLVSTRTSKEYGVASNFAEDGEALRAPSVAAGDLAEAEVLARLGTGLYLSNLHYLNWSDQPGGRVTGMTRYACFWVEDGEMVCPIENLRFDDTIFRLFDESLEALSESRAYLPDPASYGMRALGGMWAPGALLSAMSFTL